MGGVTHPIFCELCLKSRWGRKKSVQLKSERYIISFCVTVSKERNRWTIFCNGNGNLLHKNSKNAYTNQDIK